MGNILLQKFISKCCVPLLGDEAAVPLPEEITCPSVQKNLSCYSGGKGCRKVSVMFYS